MRSVTQFFLQARSKAKGQRFSLLQPLLEMSLCKIVIVQMCIRGVDGRLDEAEFPVVFVARGEMIAKGGLQVKLYDRMAISLAGRW